jgi:hypothetical protein
VPSGARKAPEPLGCVSTAHPGDDHGHGVVDIAAALDVSNGIEVAGTKT